MTDEEAIGIVLEAFELYAPDGMTLSIARSEFKDFISFAFSLWPNVRVLSYSDHLLYDGPREDLVFEHAKVCILRLVRNYVFD